MAQISEITINNLGLDTRIDSEYYQPIYLQAEEAVGNENVQRVSDVGKFIIGPFGSTVKIEDYVEKSNSRYIRGKDVKNFFVDDLDNAYIPDDKYSNLKKYHVSVDDLLITVVGTLGNVSVVTEDVGNAIFSCKSTILRPSKILPGYLCIYLNTKQGKGLLMRNERGAVQTGFNLKDLENIPLPRFDNEIEERINEQYFNANKLRQKSKFLYKQAEEILLTELGLLDFVPEWVAGYETDRDNILDAARMDAEYFQPRYTKIIKSITTKKYTKVSEVAHFVGHSSQPGYEDGGNIAVLAQKHMKGSLQVDYESFDNFTTAEHIKKSDKQYILDNNDILVSSAGAPGLTNVWQGEQKTIPGSFVTVVRAKDIDPLYLALCLNSLTGRMQFEQNFTGSVQQYVYPSKIAEIVIPRLGEKIEQVISQKIQNSFDLSHESRKLLEDAKREVEEMIENRK